MNPFSSTLKCARRLVVALVAIATLIAAVGCGSSGSNSATPPPGGSFSNSSLSGTYVFSFVGTDITTGNSIFFAMAGTLTANGNGTFTSGTIDINDPALSINVLTGLAATGSYKITADGRGSGTFTVTIAGTPVTFGIDFALMSSSHGLITRFDFGGSGSGTIDLMASGVTQSALQGSYAFGFSGVDSGFNPLGTVGGFTLDASGKVTAGLQDFNDNFISFTALPLISPPSSVNIATTPGIAQLDTGPTGFNTLSFDVWVVDATHLKFIETDTVAILAGDAFVSTGHTSFPSGQLVFTMSGQDTAGGPFAAGGLFTSDGISLIPSGTQDLNDEGTVVLASAFSGSFTSVGGRSQLTLNTFYNGNFGPPPVPGTYTFAAYPYNGGVELLEIDNAGDTGGVAYVQSATSVAAPQGYALNLSGVNGNSGGEVDEIAEFVASGGSMSGLYDVNNLGVGLVSDFKLGSGASYSVSSNGRGTAAFPNLQTNDITQISALDLTFYVVNSSTIVFLETDNDQLALGSFQLQNPTQGGAPVLPHFTMARSKSSARGAWKQLGK